MFLLYLSLNFTLLYLNLAMVYQFPPLIILLIQDLFVDFIKAH